MRQKKSSLAEFYLVCVNSFINLKTFAKTQSFKILNYRVNTTNGTSRRGKTGEVTRCRERKKMSVLRRGWERRYNDASTRDKWLPSEVGRPWTHTLAHKTYAPPCCAEPVCHMTNVRSFLSLFTTLALFN